MKAKINDCMFCGIVSVVSTHFKEYVCDDCYQNRLEKENRCPTCGHEYAWSLPLTGIKRCMNSDCGHFGVKK
jgi:transcription elongation factor Elf1